VTKQITTLNLEIIISPQCHEVPVGLFNGKLKLCQMTPGRQGTVHDEFNPEEEVQRSVPNHLWQASMVENLLVSDGPCHTTAYLSQGANTRHTVNHGASSINLCFFPQ
jgi:hypothetical protein